MSDRATHDEIPSRSPHSKWPLEFRRELTLTYAGICITLIASLFALGGIARSVVEAAVLHRWGASLGQVLFLGIAGFLIYGGLVYQVARIGHLRRLLSHRPAGEQDLH